MIAQIDKNFIGLSLKKTLTRYISYAFYEGRPLTTRGRWINPLVFILYRIQTFLPFAKAVQKPIFILGTGRSGTTILGVTLGIHKEVGFLNEPKAFWSYLFDEEDLIGSYQEKEAKYWLTANDVTPSIIKKAHRVYGNYLRFCASSRIVDKYPELIFRTDFVKAIFPDAKFLFLYRNGDDTCHSISLWSKRQGAQIKNETHDWWGRNDRKWNLLCDQVVAKDDELGPHVNEIKEIKNHIHRAAVEWIVSMKEGLELLSKLEDSVLGVKYEDYVSNRKERDRVLTFCGLNPDANFDSYCDSVLKAPKSKSKISLPSIIEKEYNAVMHKLGYE